jgi:hypothetical protein
LQPADRDHGDSSFRHGDSGTAAGPVLQMAQRTALLAKIGPDRVLPYHPRPDVHAVLAEAGVRNVGGNHPRRDDDIPRGPDQTVEAVSDRGGDRGDGHGNKLAAIT